MIRKMCKRRRIDDNGILNDGRLTSFMYKINISDCKLTPVGGRFAVGILAHILCHISGAGAPAKTKNYVNADGVYIFREKVRPFPHLAKPVNTTNFMLAWK